MINDAEVLLTIAKRHLRIDFDDDNSYISFLIQTAIEYINDAVDPAAISDPRNEHRLTLLMMVIITDMYEHRSMSFEGNSKAQYTIRSIINQLQAGDDDE